MDDQYDFTTDWFSKYWPNWLTLIADQRISKILEIGSFEGRSACTMIDHFSKTGPLEIFCVDDWSGSSDLAEFDMEMAEQRFNRNIQRAIDRAPNAVKVQKFKGTSGTMLATLLVSGYKSYFDLIFVDGSHEGPDVLSDLVMSYQLAAIGGLIICDDYLWSGVPHGSEDLLAMPRLAVDAFGLLFARKVALWGDLPLYQAYFRKTS